MSEPITVHIINHTHWDREWFLTSEYTSRWIPRLIDRIAQLAAENPGYRYLFDGQTLVIEDLLRIAPQYEERVRALVTKGHLQIGPYYCQPDWQLTCGELLIRNLLLGQKDVLAWGGQPPTAGWLVDTFGHISQAPQIHRLADVDAAFVWRGVPLLQPYFTWQSPDGSALLAINLFGGYRNLYGVTHAPQVAIKRLQAEVQKLRPFYPTGDVPLFDGYDLEDNPEDPVRFYLEQIPHELEQMDGDVRLQETTPQAFARAISQTDLDLVTLRGELNSGKYGATFPGTFSTRTYLKIMADDCERLLFRVTEPLAAIAYLFGRAFEESKYERWTRQLLQNAVHDCICGVSIDQVHEKMEFSYRALYDALWQDVHASLAAISPRLQEGQYAISTNPFALEGWQVAGASLLRTRTEGVGVWPVVEHVPLQHPDGAVPSFTWRNEHYEATVQPDGTVTTTHGRFGALVVSAEHGDAYSTEPGTRLGVVSPRGPLKVVQKSSQHAVIAFGGLFEDEAAGVMVSADVRLWFDPSPLIRWQIDLDSRGTDLRVDMVFETALDGQPHAAMPFDLVRRPVADEDLLPRVVSAHLSQVLLGQRELRAVHDFPMQDFVARSAANGYTIAILARGLRSYRAGADGTIVLPLRRAVEWVTKADLKDRVGDAGPFFYVPDARCERRVRHEIGLAAGPFAPDSMALQRLNAGFQNAPLLIHAPGAGPNRAWQLLHEELPLSVLTVREGKLLARFYNPLGRSYPFSGQYSQIEAEPDGEKALTTAPGHKIVSVQLAERPREAAHAVAAAGNEGAAAALFALLTPPTWRVGANKGRPEPAVMTLLAQRMAALADELAQVEAQMAQVGGAQRLRLQHRAYILERERLEYQLSHLLNQRKLQEETPLRYEYLYGVDPQVAEVGKALNDLRIKRRIFDYVVQAL